MNETILTKLYDAIVTLQEDVSEIKVQQKENTVVIQSTNEQAKKTNGRVSKHDEILESVNKTLAEQVHWNSKIHGQFEAHQQFITERIKDNKDFAEREINLLKTNIGHACEADTEVQVEKIKAKSETWKTVSATVGIIASLIIGIANIIYK